MYATTTATKRGTSVTIPLKFEHRMAKITVLAMAVDKVSKIRGIRIISGYRKVNIADPVTATPGTVDKTDETTALSPTSPLMMYSHNGDGENVVFAAAVLPPQTVEGNFLVFDTDDGLYTYPIRQTTLEGGHAYTLALRVGAVQGSDEGGVGNTSGANGHRLTIGTIADQIYTGSELTPDVPVTNEAGQTLNNDDDGGPYYKVVYSNATQVGSAQVIVVGLGEYTGCVATSQFNILQKAGTIAFAEDAVELTYWPGTKYNGNTLIVSPTGPNGADYGTLTYSTEDTDIISVDAGTGEVTLYDPVTVSRTAIVTATVTDSRNYHYAVPTASYSITIHPRTGIGLDDNIQNWDDGSGTNGTVEF